MRWKSGGFAVYVKRPLERVARASDVAVRRKAGEIVILSRAEPAFHDVGLLSPVKFPNGFEMKKLFVEPF